MKQLCPIPHVCMMQPARHGLTPNQCCTAGVHALAPLNHQLQTSCAFCILLARDCRGIDRPTKLMDVSDRCRKKVRPEDQQIQGGTLDSTAVLAPRKVHSYCKLEKQRGVLHKKWLLYDTVKLEKKPTSVPLMFPGSIYQVTFAESRNCFCLSHRTTTELCFSVTFQWWLSGRQYRRRPGERAGETQV